MPSKYWVNRAPICSIGSHHIHFPGHPLEVQADTNMAIEPILCFHCSFSVSHALNISPQCPIKYVFNSKCFLRTHQTPSLSPTSHSMGCRTYDTSVWDEIFFSSFQLYYSVNMGENILMILGHLLWKFVHLGLASHFSQLKLLFYYLATLSKP